MSRKTGRPAVDLEMLPTPLVRAVLAWKREDAATRPFRAVHRLIDALEVLCKLYTVAGVSRFVEVLVNRLGGTEAPSEEHAEQLDRVRAMLAAGLRTPSLGIWWSFARETARALDALGESHVLPGGIEALTRKKSALKKAFDADDNLVSFRNKYAHGATPDDEACLEDLERVGPRMERLLASAHPLAEATLLVVLEDGSVRVARGAHLATMDSPPEGLEPGHCYFLGQDGLLVDLHPLLVFDPEGGPDGEGAFFFYNDLRANHAALLNYPFSLHRRDKPLRDALLDRFPIHEWKDVGGPDLDPFRERIEALTEQFKGRQDELQGLADFLAGAERGFYVVWGPPGVGKSALLARMIQLLQMDPELREQAAPGITWPELRLEVVEYFIRRGSTDTAERMLDSLNQRLDARFRLRMPLGSTDEERRQQFLARLKEIGKRLGEDQRLVLVIDGLDEARTDDPLLGSLPRDVPARVLVIYGARPRSRLKNGLYDELDREHRQSVELEGLSREDTRAMLYPHVDKYALEPEYVEAVARRSKGNPLFLKLLCQGLETGIYELNDVSQIPEEMKDLYANALVRIEQEAPGSTDLLTLLAAARDFVSPAMAAELMGTTETELRAGPLAACMELLWENPLTEELEDYQLFHESLREYLQEKSGADVRRWEKRLADWASEWRTADGDPRHEAERLVYAMAYAVPHQAACLEYALAAGKEAEARRRGDTILALVEDEAWRTLCFRACGNGTPLRRAIRHAQRVARSRDRNGSEAGRILRLACWYHDEPARLYDVQRELLRKPAAPGDAHHFEDMVQLAKMGARPRDRVLLGLTALWASAERPRSLPRVFHESMQQWLEEAREPALNLLWEIGLGGGIAPAARS